MQQQQVSCISCKRYFDEGQTLPPEGIHIEYKKYYLPIKDHQPKWILLKTIVAFLNSKGGTIFMGVDDATREVVGVTAELKEQDVFMLDFAQLIENIQPEVDLRRKEEVKVRFVPVLKDKSFQGKYIIKIIVKQGDPSKVYHFAQTLRFVCEDKKHHDEDFKVLWGFYRSNMGKVDSIKGTELLREVYQKAKNPSIVAQTYHPGCNPQPLQVSVRNMNIGFKNLKNAQLKDQILQFIEHKFKALNLATTYTVSESQEDDTVIIKFKSITDYKQADNCIADHEKQISLMIEGKDSLIDEGFIDNTHFYKIGQPFNPSLRYLRNRSKSRNRSIEINDKKSANKPLINEVNSPTSIASHHPTENPTRFKKKQNQQVEVVEKTQHNKPTYQFAKNLPKQDLEEPEEDEEELQEEELSPQLAPKISPKKFQAKPDEFPQLATKNISSKNRKSVKKNGEQEATIKVLPPKANGLIEMNGESPLKQSISKRQNASQKLDYNITISNIFENTYQRFIHYLEHSLGNKLQKIPHKVQQDPSSKEAVIHFHSLNDIQAFMQELSKNLHHKQVFNGFGDGKTVKVTVKKGNKVQQFNWAEKGLDRDQSNEQTKVVADQSLKIKQSPKKQSEGSSKDIKSPSSKSPSPVDSFSQKVKLKYVEIKGYPFVISNLRTDLSDLEKTHLGALLRQIFKHFCQQNAKVEILNEKTFNGIVELNFENSDERKKFSDLMQTQIIKYHELTDFFKGHKAYWGVASGNIILHHYKAEDKKAFKQEVDNLFPEGGQCPMIDSKYIKEEGKYFLRVSFHTNKVVAGLEKLYQNVNKSPIRDFASSKEGIVILPEINRI